MGCWHTARAVSTYKIYMEDNVRFEIYKKHKKTLRNFRLTIAYLFIPCYNERKCVQSGKASCGIHYGI